MNSKLGTGALPRQSDMISQTCARWRKVSFTCPQLWTNIYLGPHPTLFYSLLDHAKSHAQRAGHFPLELLITDVEGQVNPNFGLDKVRLQEFLTSIAPRTKSLEIVRRDVDSLFTRGIESEGLVGIIRGCSEIFTRLVVHLGIFQGPGFIQHIDQDVELWDEGDILIDLSLEEIERAFTHLTVLQATQVYPRWSTSAYHGLVDLRLITNHKYASGCPNIERPEFSAILSASPHLRILYFGLHLVYAGHDAPANYNRVQLDDLEVLHLSASGVYSPEDTEYEIQRIMEHINLGSKPLRLTLDLDGYQDSEPLAEMKSFFSKSHIVKFCTKKGTPPPTELLECAPHLTNLVFDHCRYGSSYDPGYNQSGAIKLDSWVIWGSSIYTDDFEPLVKQYSARSIIIANCHLFEKDAGPVEISESYLELLH